MFDQLIEICNETQKALEEEKAAKFLLDEAKSKVEEKKKALRSLASREPMFCDQKFQEVLYPYNGEIYLIQYSDGFRTVLAQKVEFYKPEA